MEKELKKEWRDEFEQLWMDSFDMDGAMEEPEYDKLISFVDSLLSKQQTPTAMTNSEWERNIDDMDWSMLSTKERIKTFIRPLLAKQQDTPMGVSEWMRIGKLHGYHDYWKDMTRIALQEEFVKCLPEKKEIVNSPMLDRSLDNAHSYGYNQCIADIKSKINKTNV
jgi:hypothetical protein